MSDKQEIRLIDWSQVGGVTWRAHVWNGDTRWRRWRRPWLEPQAHEGDRVAVEFEAAIYPWTRIQAVRVMEGL